MKDPIPPRLLKFSASKQRRLDLLLEKNSNGTITAKEKPLLRQLVKEAEECMIANAKKLALFAKTSSAPSNAVPVTVWVQSQQAE